MNTDNTQQTWLCGGTLLTMEEHSDPIEASAVGICEGKIIYAGSQASAEIPHDANRVDTRNTIVMPGLVNGHTHTGMSLLRGIADDLPLDRWLNEAIFPLERKWTSPEFVYTGTLLACAEMIRSGTILFNDMYYLEEQAARAAADAGLHIIAGLTFVEASGVADLSAFFDEFDRYLEQMTKYPNAIPAITPHSIYGLSEKSWRQTIDYASKRNLLLHFHLSETQSEVDNSIAKYGRSPVKFFEDLGLWQLPRVVAAHATCLSDTDIEILSRYRASVVHNIESNLKLGTKICPVVDLLKNNIKVALGTDSTASNNNLDLLQEVDTAAKAQVLRYGMGKLRAKDWITMLTSGGATALHMQNSVGTISVGRTADLIVVDTSAPHAVPLYDPYSHLVYSASGSDVRDMWACGKPVMRDRKILSFDEAAALEAAAEFASHIAKDRR